MHDIYRVQNHPSMIQHRRFTRPPIDALDAKQAMGVHWSTFKLTQESFDHPPRDLAAALHSQGLAQDTVWLMRHGETRAVPI